MTESKRWIVTFTKHIHQKRKVYQDGVLVVNGSRNKVMLYDDSEKLLGSRFLKKNEMVESGSTLALESHLVDIGEPEGNHKPLTDMNKSVRDKKLNEKNMVKAAKRTSLHNVSTVTNKQETMNGGRREWDALYTTQLTQKAKKYHDGTLRLAGCGSHANQVILLDEDGNILASKFPKSVDRIESGNTYQMPGYLVEVCEQRNIQREESKKKASVNGEAVPSSSLVTKIPSSGNVLKESKKKDSVDGEAVPSSSSFTKIRSIGNASKFSKTNNLSNEATASSISDAKTIPTFTKLSRNTTLLNDQQDDSMLFHQYTLLLGKEKVNLADGSTTFIAGNEKCRNKNTLKELSNTTRSSNPSKVVITGEVHTKKPHLDVLKRKNSLEEPNSTSSNSQASEVLGAKEIHANKPLRDATQILNSLKKIVPEESAGHDELKVEKARPSKFPVSNPDGKVSNGKVILVPENGEYSRVFAGDGHGKDHQGLLMDNAIENAYPGDDRDESNTSDTSRSMATSAQKLDNNFFPGADSNWESRVMGFEILDVFVLSKNKELNATVSDGFVQCGSSCDPTNVPENVSKYKSTQLVGEEKENCYHELSNSAKEIVSADDKGTEVGAVRTSLSEFVKDELHKQVNDNSINVETEISDEKRSGKFLTAASITSSPCHAMDVIEETSQENSSISKKRIKVCNFPSFDLGI